MYLTADTDPMFSTAAFGSPGYVFLRAKVERLVAEVPAQTSRGTLAWKWARVEALLPRIDLLLEEMTAAIEAGGSGDDHASRAAILSTHQHLAGVCDEYVRALWSCLGCSDVRSLRAMAYCLLHIGESLKHTMGRDCQCPYSAGHELWKLAAASGHARESLCLPVGGVDRLTSIDRLYLRALALAWGTQIGLGAAQMKIFDGWIWTWMTALQCSPHPLRGQAVRADPDGIHGISTRPAHPNGRNVYLSRVELESALRILSSELAAGRTVPGGEGGRGALEEQRRTLAVVLRAIVGSGGA